MNCRGCFSPLSKTFIDLGVSPIANNLLTAAQLAKSEDFFPLHVRTCDTCGLVQLPEISPREALFPDNYTYYSSYSKSWLLHSKKFALCMINKFNLNSNDLVIEVASNDGYLLQYFREMGIHVLGIEPAAEVAKVAREERGVSTIVNFFGKDSANIVLTQYSKSRLIIANNVLAHVPDIHDFVAGFQILLEDNGIATFEFPHLLNLILNTQFDTIYHEHYSYLSVTALRPIFAKHGLRIFDLENLETHGGSLRIYVCKSNSDWPEEKIVEECVSQERMYDPRLNKISSKFQSNAMKIRLDLLKEIEGVKKKGLTLAAYGAAAKGNTLLNFLSLTSNDIDYVVDRNPYKQGKYLPGSRIPIVDENHLENFPPDVLIILPWNLSVEIMHQLHYLKSHGVTFLRAIPQLEYF